MSSPCGKCNTCPCSSQSNQPARPQEPQQQQQQQQQQPQPQPQAPHTTNQQDKRPRVECLCAQKRQNTAPLQAPLADTYTCTRRAEPKPAQVPIEERCTCKAKAAPPQCECTPPVIPPHQPTQPAPETHAYVACGQPTPQRQHTNEHHRNYHNRPACGHCQSQKKKCIIQ